MTAARHPATGAGRAPYGMGALRAQRPARIHPLLCRRLALGSCEIQAAHRAAGKGAGSVGPHGATPLPRNHIIPHQDERLAVSRVGARPGAPELATPPKLMRYHALSRSHGATNPRGTAIPR